MYTGDEQLYFTNSEGEIEKTDFTILDFWRWGYSELLDNTLRGAFAEYIVRSAIQLNGYNPNEGVRWWHPYDLTGPGGLRIEVKCSAYLMAREQEKLANISFGIAPTKLFNEYADYSNETARHSDVFVFCHWAATDKKISILDMDYWDFYVLATKVLNDKCPDQKSIQLDSLLKLNPIKCKFSDIRKSIMLEHAKRGPYTYNKIEKNSDENSEH